MSITIKKGSKSKNDKIFTFNEKQFENIELLDLILKICINEDNNYPDGLGGQYFINCIQEIYNKKEITSEIKEKYKL
tara:strand:- start:1082 stop:1312 length:231 start_codon:yes stop_codon:yes gene_type:complete